MIRVLLTFLIALPLSLSAQTVEELQARIAALMTQIQAIQSVSTQSVSVSSSACPTLARPLSMGARGEDVRTLQEFLRTRGLLQSEATGYFGTLTEAAIRAFQSTEGIVSSGDAVSTGFGMVGARTRAAIAARCSNSQTVTTSPAAMCPEAPANPSISCAGSWQKLQSGSCHTGWRCVLSAMGNKAPVIDAIEGPSVLAVGQSGAWRVVAQDPEGGALSFSVTWGDERVEDILRSLAGLSSSFVSSPTLSHAYAKAGSYTVRVDVKDGAGVIASATHGVTVSANSASTTPSFPFLPPTATATVKKSCVTPWGAQVIGHGQASFWQPFFTEGAYFPATSSPVVKCDNGGWLTCSAIGTECQNYTPASSPASSALRSYANVIGTPCSGVGTTTIVIVPPGTQLCQWLSCSVTTEARAITLKCMDGGWSDYQSY